MTVSAETLTTLEKHIRKVMEIKKSFTFYEGQDYCVSEKNAKKIAELAGLKFIGIGAYRMVLLFDNLIIKIPLFFDSLLMNRTEYDFWNLELKDSPIANCFVPALHTFMDCCVYPLIKVFKNFEEVKQMSIKIEEVIAKVQSYMHHISKKFQSFIYDIYIDYNREQDMTWKNLGIYNGQVVILDYAL